MSATATSEISSTVRTTAQQVRVAGIRGDRVAVDDVTLRVVKRGRKATVQTDITYRPGLDLYDVTVRRVDLDPYRETFGEVVAEREYHAVYADQLADVAGAWR